MWGGMELTVVVVVDDDIVGPDWGHRWCRWCLPGSGSLSFLVGLCGYVGSGVDTQLTHGLACHLAFMLQQADAPEPAPWVLFPRCILLLPSIQRQPTSLQRASASLRALRAGRSSVRMCTPTLAMPR